MELANPSEPLLPQALIAEVEALAAAEQRPAREAVELYLRDRQSATEIAPRRTPQEAAARMLELRKGRHLPEGVTIRDLMTYGRD